MTLSIKLPDTGKRWSRWAGNLLAWPCKGMHAVWRREAQETAKELSVYILRAAYDGVRLKGHSRGAVVALYSAAMLRERFPALKIEVFATGAPRCWWGRRGRDLRDTVVQTCYVSNYRARGDFVTWLLPWFGGHPAAKVGEGWWPCWRKHKLSYYRLYTS